MPTVDRRTRKTKRALGDALLDLMTEKGYDAVTVQDIIDRADVGRSTFYNHYPDKDSLLHDNLADLRAILTQPATADPTHRRRLLLFSLNMFRHVAAQHRLAYALFHNSRGGPVLRELETLLADVVHTELSTTFGTHTWTRAPQDAVVRSVVGAYLSLLDWWVTTNLHHSPDDMDRIFHTLIGPGIRAATRNKTHPS